MHEDLTHSSQTDTAYDSVKTRGKIFQQTYYSSKATLNQAFITALLIDAPKVQRSVRPIVRSSHNPIICASLQLRRRWTDRAGSMKPTDKRLVTRPHPVYAHHNTTVCTASPLMRNACDSIWLWSQYRQLVIYDVLYRSTATPPPQLDSSIRVKLSLAGNANAIPDVSVDLVFPGDITASQAFRIAWYEEQYTTVTMITMKTVLLR